MERVHRLNLWKQVIGRVYLIASFGILDVWLRVATRWIGAYSIYELAPNLFTLLWSVLLVATVMAPSSQRAGRLLYTAAYSICGCYALVQYGAYLTLGRFLFVSDFLLAGEGADYLTWAITVVSPTFILIAIATIIIGIIGVVIFPLAYNNSKRHSIVCLVIGIVCLVCMTFVPKLYGEVDETHFWSQSFEYNAFTNANYDMELAGMYQFVARDIKLQLSRGKRQEEDIQTAATFFAEKATHTANSLSGVFAGKNLIVVMMESLDDWVITETDTPTIYRLMNNGIKFSNFYTPQYSNGYTFNSEFAFNTGIYPYRNGNIAYFTLNNSFPYSIGNRFKTIGYAVNSFHEGSADFYNRGENHLVWGFEKYYSYQDYSSDGISIYDDRFIVACNELYADLVSATPFFSFVITYSPHLPYSGTDEAAQIALSLYPQYNTEADREVNVLRAKARLTDDMFNQLLTRLEEDGLLEDTVIVGFGDHYAYGLSDKNQLQKLSEEAGCPILEKTPAFIYCAGMDLAMTVDKVAQITDLAPTIMNLFGLEVPREIMGRDIFDDTYEGYVIFPNGSWLTEQAYVRDRVLQWNNGMIDEEIAAMNSYVQQVYQVNDAILNSDYYAYKD